ncbi:MAG: transposase [Gemmataceae bacterium]|nr:transposase [Gemmataceae bacterium]
MSQSLARNVIHLVFSTKNREPLIAPAVREGLFAYLAGTLNALDCPAITVGGVADHVHLLFALAKTLPLCKAVEEVKKGSSKWGKEHVAAGFYWQTGYGAFSVSRSNEPVVAAYVADQERHHARRTFQDEFREFLRRHGIEWDERYVWD